MRSLIEMKLSRALQRWGRRVWEGGEEEEEEDKVMK